jgi:antitoxin (DNA-binding transcriptional repressor) of toxin-antitoxin stability system
MPNIIPMHQAKSTLSQLVQRAAAGETVLIGPNGQAVAKLTALNAAATPKRRLGALKGQLRLPADFDAPLPEGMLRDFEGGAA